MAKNAITDWSQTAASNSDVGGIDIAENCDAANINNAIREIMAQLATWLAALYATAANIWAGSSTTKTISPSSLKDATAFVALTASGSTFTPDMSAGRNFTIALTGNSTLGNITNGIPGQGGVIVITEDATGGRTLSKPGSNKYYGPSGFPMIDTTANAVSVFSYVYVDSNTTLLFPARTMSNV